MTNDDNTALTIAELDIAPIVGHRSRHSADWLDDMILVLKVLRMEQDLTLSLYTSSEKNGLNTIRREDEE